MHRVSSSSCKWITSQRTMQTVCWEASAFMPLSKVSAELLICSRWHFNSSLQLIFNSSQNTVSANISNKAAPSPWRCWPFFSDRASAWGFGVNICFFLQRQKSCPSGSAAVCKRGAANGCCGTHSGIREAEGLISPKVLRGVQPLPAINGPAREALRSLSLASLCFCVITCIIAADVMSSPLLLWRCRSPNINIPSVTKLLQTRRVSSGSAAHADDCMAKRLQIDAIWCLCPSKFGTFCCPLNNILVSA